GMSEVRPPLPPAARPVPVDQTEGPPSRDPSKLAGARRPLHRRDERRAHPRPGRPGCERHGDPDRQARPLHRGRRRSAAVPAAVALAGILGALRITGTPLALQRFLFLGAGSAAVGTADLLVKAMRDEGVPEPDVQSRVALFDRKGLVTAERETLHDYQRPFAQRHTPIADFVAAIETLRPTGIIGLPTV